MWKLNLPFNYLLQTVCRNALTPFIILQASDNAKEAEDNARKAKGAVKNVLGIITNLLDQLGKTKIKLKNTIIWLIWHLRAYITDQSEWFNLKKIFVVLNQQIWSLSKLMNLLLCLVSRKHWQGGPEQTQPDRRVAEEGQGQDDRQHAGQEAGRAEWRGADSRPDDQRLRPADQRDPCRHRQPQRHQEHVTRGLLQHAVSGEALTPPNTPPPTLLHPFTSNTLANMPTFYQNSFF